MNLKDFGQTSKSTRKRPLSTANVSNQVFKPSSTPYQKNTRMTLTCMSCRLQRSSCSEYHHHHHNYHYPVAPPMECILWVVLAFLIVNSHERASGRRIKEDFSRCVPRGLRIRLWVDGPQPLTTLALNDDMSVNFAGLSLDNKPRMSQTSAEGLISIERVLVELPNYLRGAVSFVSWPAIRERQNECRLRKGVIF